jgi:PAS domain S-box-containing protein
MLESPMQPALPPPRNRSTALPVPDFRALFEALPGLYLVLLPDEPDYTIVAVNTAYAHATLARPEEIIGRGLFEVFPDNPDDPQATGVRNLQASLQRVLATRAPDTMEVQKYDIRAPGSKGGFEERYWSPVNSPLLDANGGVRFIVHRVEDITDFWLFKRDQAEPMRADQIEAALFSRSRELARVKQLMQELRESERRFRIAFDEAPIGMVLSTPEGLILDANQAFVDMLRYPLEELRSRSTSYFTHPDDIPRTGEFITVLADRAPAIIEKRYIRKDGEIVWVRASVSMCRDERGMPTELIGAVEDITERKRAETALCQQWHTFDTALSNTPDFTYIFDLDGRFTYVNRAPAVLMGETARRRGRQELLRPGISAGTRRTPATADPESDRHQGHRAGPDALHGADGRGSSLRVHFCSCVRARRRG